MDPQLADFTDIIGDEIPNSQPMSLPSSSNSNSEVQLGDVMFTEQHVRPPKRTGQHGEFRCVDEIDPKYRDVFSYRYFNLVQSRVIDDALYSDKSMVVCAPTGSGKTVIFEMAIVQLLMDIDDRKYNGDFKIIYMAPVKALCTERLTEWYPKFTKLGLMCIEVTGDTDVDFNQLKPYRVIITTPEKWDILTRRWRDHRGLVEVIKLFLIDEVHILNDDTRGPVLEAVVSRMKTIESSAQSAFRIERLQKQYANSEGSIAATSKHDEQPPRMRFIAVSATVSNPEDVAMWLGMRDKPALHYKFGDECRPVVLKRVVEGYPCPEGTSIFKFDIILNYKLRPIIQKYHNGKPTLIFCNTRKSVTLTAETLSRELTCNFNPEQKSKLAALASTIKNKKLQSLVLSGVGCHHAGLLYEERLNIEQAFRNKHLPILITTTTLAMGVNLPAHLVIIKNTQHYVNGAYQEYSMSMVLQMVGRAGRPQFDTEATAVIMTRAADKSRYQALVHGCEPLQSYLHKRLPENLNSEAALGTVNDVAQCVQWLQSTFLYVRTARDPKRYLGLPTNAPQEVILQKIEELCMRAMNGLSSAGLITMDEATCIQSTEAGRLMSVYYLDLETMKLIMKINGTESLENLLCLLCESHELADMHLRVDERRCLNALNRNNAAVTIRFPMKGKITTKQMKANCVIQATLGCLAIPDPSLNQESMKIMRIAERVCKCLVAYVTRPDLISGQPKFFSAVLNSLILAQCITAHLWENSPYVSKQLKGIGPAISTLLATAAKTNFMLLEESHPRDLERIMNKGAPAGNVLRKQIALLPKYQITITPIDARMISVQLLLVNYSYLSENMEHLTAGKTHKCYILAGDSENHVLLLKSFMDKDLIGLYEGCIIYELTRKHNFEHKVTIYCVSSRFVGIDEQCEYLFKNLEPVIEPTNVGKNSLYFHDDSPPKKVSQKQTCITDNFKERKRRNTDENIVQSKEKKRRGNALTEKIRILKESYGKASKELEDDVQKSKMIAQNVSFDVAQRSENEFIDRTNGGTKIVRNNITSINLREIDDNKLIQNNTLYESDTSFSNMEIDNILANIEAEQSKDYSKRLKKCVPEMKLPADQESKCNSSCIQINKKLKLKKPQNKARLKKSNFDFLDLLEKNNLSDEEHPTIHQKDHSFSETIKQHINTYLQETGLLSKLPNISNTKLIENNSSSNDRSSIEKIYDIDVLPAVDLNPSELINSNVENKDTIKDNSKQVVSVSTTYSKMQASENDNRCKSEDGNIDMLHSLIHKKNDTFNTLKVQEVIDNLTSIENDLTKYINTVVGSPSKLKPNSNTIDTHDISYIRDTICKKVIKNSKSECTETQDQIRSSLPLIPFEYNNSVVQNIVFDSKGETYKSHNNISKFKNSTKDIKSVKSPYKIGTIQAAPTIKLTNNLPVLDNITFDGYKDNRSEIIYDSNKRTNSHNTLNEYMSTVDLIATSKEDNDTNKDRYEKKYSYSSENVNTSIHNTQELQIRVIKTLKVNLDITEIVTPNRVKDQNADGPVFGSPVYLNKPITKNASAINRIPTCLKCSDSNIEIQPVQYAIAEELLVDNREERIHNSPKYSKIYKETRLENEDIKNNDNNDTSFKNKLQNILYKHYEVLRKKMDSDSNINIEPKNTHSENEANSKIEKINRPFKITDIDKVDINLSLPSLTSEPFKYIPHRIGTQTVKEDIGESRTIDDLTDDKNNIIQNYDELSEMCDVEFVSPVPSSDLNIDNFKLDHSMFDPRTVLQCLSNDDTVVIPPPPQFRDVNYSPGQLRYDGCNNEQYSESMCNVDDFGEFASQDSKSDFVEDSIYNDNLTQLLEIETLVLSQEYDSGTPVKESFTTIDKNLSGQSIRLRDAILTSRRTNLNKFKFINKNKLRK